ncbi:hypothetical protein ACA910_017178 [Epithemia clementina (nom. ined.)]
MDSTLGSITSSSDTDVEKEMVFPHRRLQEKVNGGGVPSYIEPMMKDLEERKKLFREAAPEEVKYWFEYSGPLQKYYYRFSKSRGKPDFFEGRDDSGVISARFASEPGGGKEYRDLFLEAGDDVDDVRLRLLENCFALGNPMRPETGRGTTWYEWFGKSSIRPGQDRCRILFALNTVGAGRRSTMLWETSPPVPSVEPGIRWISEQETSATHLERNLKEINAMCETGLIAARVQVLVCENISPKWIEWMDSLLVACGGRPLDLRSTKDDRLEERPSPLQVVVASSAQTADTCHDLKSGFMEQRMQDLIFAHSGNPKASTAQKTTDPALVSSDAHDLYVAMTWSTLVSLRAVASFLQASADLAAADASPLNKGKLESNKMTTTSPFLVPSFVQVSYVSEENSKVAKWRMHGDFFHPAAWEICKESFEMTWITGSLSGAEVQGICPSDEASCGQWWLYLVEMQMPISPGVYANEVVSPPVEGGSNSFYMLTETHRQRYVKGLLCRQEERKDCSPLAQAVLPLGDMQSFLINYTPNTALGKRHKEGRRPGYSKAEQLERDRELVKERKQLEGVEDIESALFDYTIYPSALLHKDATLKAVRARDAAMTGVLDFTKPQQIKSSYYDITITKPRPPVLGWCQAMARKGLCSLYADYFRQVNKECREACGMARDFTSKDVVEEVEIGTAVKSKK